MFETMARIPGAYFFVCRGGLGSSCLGNLEIGGWGGEYEVPPTGKSFRFVRACERAGDAREINRGYLEEFAG